MGQNPATLDAAINAARVAEIAQGGESSDVSSQLSDLRKDMKRLADKYDTVTAAASLTAAVQPPKAVRAPQQFNRPPQRQFGPRFTGQQQQQSFRMQAPRQSYGQPYARGAMRQQWQSRQQFMRQQFV